MAEIKLTINDPTYNHKNFGMRYFIRIICNLANLLNFAHLLLFEIRKR